MKSILLCVFLLWASLNVHAHGFDYSVIHFTENEDKTWRLHISSSLDAFRKEVRQHFSDTPYTTPEQFNQQLLAHIEDTLKISAKTKVIPLGQGKVSLGHETSVVFNSINIPKHTHAIKFVNGALKDIYRHTTKLIVAGQHKAKKSYILNKSNQFSVDLQVAPPSPDNQLKSE